MSTRCQIGIGGHVDLEPEVLIYRHWDGYPEGVLKDLIPFLKKFDEKRGIQDTEYCAARLLQHFMKDDPEGFLGYGVSSGLNFHSDIEFYYFIDIDKVNVYKVSCEGENFTLLKTEFLK